MSFEMTPFYIIASTDCQSDNPDEWQPMTIRSQECVSRSAEALEGQCARYALQGIQGDKYGILKISAEGIEVVSIHCGEHEW